MLIFRWIYEIFKNSWASYCRTLQSETKAIGQELIYEAKLQNSAWPGHRVVSCVHFYSRLSTNRTWQCFILWHTRLYLHMGHDNVSFCVLAFALASAFGYCSNLICGPFSNLHSNSFFLFFRKIPNSVL